MILTKTSKTIGPRHHGRRMTLKAFEFAKVEDGWLAELARGYLVVSGVANYFHGMQIMVIGAALRLYAAAHPGAVHAIFGSLECKLLIPKFDSERHPDIAVYLTAPKGPKDRTLWRTWIPELAAGVGFETRAVTVERKDARAYG